MMRGDVFSGRMDKMRRMMGTEIVYKGRSIPVSHKRLARGEYELLMEANRNIASSEIEQFTGGAKDCAQGPMEGEAFSWLGISYTVLMRTKYAFSGRVCGVVMAAYRTPDADSATVDEATGKRPDYTPPDSTI